MKSKKVAKFVSLTAMLFTLVGCNKTVDSASQSAEPSGSAEELLIGAPTAQQTWVKTQVEKYLADNNLSSKYTVKMYVLEEGDTGNVADWTTAPDLYAYASDQTLTLVGKGALAQVPSTYATAMKTAMGDEAMAAANVGTKTYGYPYAGDNGYFLYYNKTTFKDQEAKLATWDGVIEVAKAKTLKVSYPLANTFYSTGLMFSFGARYNVTLNSTSTAIASVDADFDGEKGIKAIKVMKNILSESIVEVTNDAQKAPTTANGLAATVDGSWNATKYKEAMGDDYGCIKLPTVTLGEETVNIHAFLGYKLYGVNPSRTGTSTARQTVLHQISNYLVSKDVQDKRFDDLTIAPTNKKVKALEKVVNTPHVKALADQAAYAVAQTIVPGNVWTDSTTPYTALKAKADLSKVTDEEIATIAAAYNTAIKTIK